jgi:hypothetical protein
MVWSRATPDWTAGSVRHGEEGGLRRSWISGCVVIFEENIKGISGVGKRVEVCRCGPSGSMDE